MKRLYKAIICGCKNLQAKKKLPQERPKGSLDNSKIKEPGISENENYPAFHRFKFKNNQMKLRVKNKKKRVLKKRWLKFLSVLLKLQC